MMYIPNQLIGAPVNTQVTMECTTEASPKVTCYIQPHLEPLPCRIKTLRSDQDFDLILISNKMHKSDSRLTFLVCKGLDVKMMEIFPSCC